MRRSDECVWKVRFEHIIIENDEKHQWDQVDEHDIDAIVRVFVVLPTKCLVCTQQDDGGLLMSACQNGWFGMESQTQRMTTKMTDQDVVELCHGNSDNTHPAYTRDE